MQLNNKPTLSRLAHDEITLIRRSIPFLVNVASEAANMAAEAIIDGRWSIRLTSTQKDSSLDINFDDK